MPNNEFGDFQTPPGLAAQVLDSLPSVPWSRILEPTCGSGTFLREVAVRAPAAELIGIEMQRGYALEARATGADIRQADIFSMHLGRDLSWKSTGPLLVVGNPPWVTSAQLTLLDSVNRPDRVNQKNLSGLDAITGASNFDIAEHIWLKLISELAHLHPTISLLCKTQVARNVLEHCAQRGLPISAASLRLIDAKHWFGANVDACLFTVDISTGPPSYVCEQFESIDATTPTRRFGVVDGQLVADVDEYRSGRLVDGVCPLEWRQGMKHDAAEVMELVAAIDGPRTRAGEPLDVEPDYVFPLLKCTDVYRGRLALTKWVIVPQRALGADTSQLASTAPRLWSYLNRNAAALDGRRSSIYRNRPRFGVFGIGDYSFAPYKVAVSGLHKAAEFRLVGPVGGRPVFVDDTCYLLPFENPAEAALVLALLRSTVAGSLLRALAFWDSKRPITKRLLRRIDLGTVATLVPPAEIAAAAAEALSTLGAPATPETLVTLLGELRRRWESRAGYER